MVLTILCAALAMAAPDEPWDKVRAVKGGAELRVFKKDGKPPVLAKMDEATADNLIVVVKDAQLAIPKDDIERIDYRPPQAGSRVTRETKTTKGVYDSSAGTQGQPMSQGKTGPPPGATSSSSSSLTVGGKPAFELLYRAKGATK